MYIRIARLLAVLVASIVSYINITEALWPTFILGGNNVLTNVALFVGMILFATIGIIPIVVVILAELGILELKQAGMNVDVKIEKK